MHPSRQFVPCVLLAAISTPANADGDKADICHWNANWAQVISVSTSAVASHFEQHGDSYVAQYYGDGDGDGFGDAIGAVLPCPNDGYVANHSDCNDGDSSVSPHASEVSCDGIDNDCDPGTIEGDCCNVETCGAGDTSGNRAEIEASFGVSPLTVCPFYFIPGDPKLHVGSLPSPATVSGEEEVWSQVIYRTVIGLDNPASDSPDSYDFGVEMEWVSAEGTHLSAGGNPCWWHNNISYEDLALVGVGLGDPVEFCAAHEVETRNLPSGTWTLKAVVSNFETNETIKTCAAATTTVL